MNLLFWRNRVTLRGKMDERSFQKKAYQDSVLHTCVPCGVDKRMAPLNEVSWSCVSASVKE